MKAFSASIFTEQTQASLKEDAYRLSIQDPVVIKSILECEDDAILMEMDAKRAYYQSLLESQQQGLGIINEAVNKKILAAVIAACIAIVTAVISFITGKGGGGGGSSSGGTATYGSTTTAASIGKELHQKEKKQQDAIKQSQTYKKLDKFFRDGDIDTGLVNTDRAVNKRLHHLDALNMGHITDDRDLNGLYNPYVTLITASKLNKLYLINPYMTNDSDDFKINSTTVRDLKQIAANTTVTITKYTYPNRDLCSGNIPSISDLVSISTKLRSLFYDLFEFDEENDGERFDKEIDTISDKIDTISDNVSQINSSGDKSEETTNAQAYLSQKFEWFKSYDGRTIRFENISSNGASLVDLRNALSDLYAYINKIDLNTTDQARFNKAMTVANKLKSTIMSLSAKVHSAFNTYWTMVEKEIKQINRVCNDLSKMGGKNEVTIYESTYYQNSPELQEYMFGRGIQDMDSGIHEFYQMVDDANTRLSIYVHQNQMRAMNEEALIFSETSLSDYEKFEKLQAVQEALGAKIKKGYYNAIAALKEIFRKFMEKLTANFGTTKAYLDRYKNIILQSQFANNQYKTQDLLLGIDRIIDSACPAMDFNKLMIPAANEVNTFFTQFVKPNLKNLNMTKDKLPDDGSGMQGINEFFKTYFCMQGHDVVITGPQFQKEIKQYYDFLYDIRKINQTIKRSLDDIDKTAANVMKKAGVNVANPPTPTEGEAPAAPAAPATPAPAPTVQPAESVVYSNLYQKWFTVNEHGVLVEAEKISNDNTNTPATPANRVQNVQAKGDSDDSDRIKDNPRSTIDAKVKVYVDVCSSMLKAKMSACEFIRNECMQIIRDHVKSYVGGGGQPTEQQQ